MKMWTDLIARGYLTGFLLEGMSSSSGKLAVSALHSHEASELHICSPPLTGMSALQHEPGCLLLA
jgi:hypothetical protein